MSNDLSFAGLASTRPRTRVIRGVVIHWTGGAGDPAQVYHTLRSRKTSRAPAGLSVHYVVAVDGTVVQMAPHNLVCLHAGPVNEWTVGIEVVSPGLPVGAAHLREKAAGVRREVYETSYGRRPIRVLDFTEAQNRSLILLVERLCDQLNVPRRVPPHRRLDTHELAAYAGILGHYHCHPTKTDPGPRIFERLAEKWK